MASSILTIGALLLLGIFMLSANSLMADNSQLADQNEYCLTSLSVGQSIIDEAKAKAFDQQTINQTVLQASGLTPVARLGPDTTETVGSPDTLSSGTFRSAAIFNDVDDYNGYVRSVSTSRIDGYSVRVSVVYASLTYPDSTSATPTFCKRMTVIVTNKYMQGQVILSYVFAN
jgi:hypothetical protein